MEKLTTLEECLKFKEEMEKEKAQAERTLENVTNMQNEKIKYLTDVIFLVDSKIKELDK